MWRVQGAVICVLWSLIVFTFVRYSDAEEAELNPLLNRTTLPRFSNIKLAHTLPAITTAFQEYETKFDEYEKQLNAKRNESRTWELVEETLEKIQFPFHNSLWAALHLSAVKGSPELTEITKAVVPFLDKARAQLHQSAAVYTAYKELKEQNPGLDEAQRRILESYLRTAYEGGAELTEQEKTKLNKINEEIRNLTMKFSNNVQDSTNTFSKLLTEKESVKGLPELVRQLLAKNAVEGTNKSADPENGPWKVKLDSPSYDPVMKHSQDRKLREELYRAHIKIACEGDHDNIKVFEQIRKDRQAIATLLGYKNYAELSLASKVIKKVEDVWTFLNLINEKSHPVALSDMQKLKEYAQSKGHEGNLENWDVEFWKERQYEELYSLKEEETRPYFPADKVLSGLFKLSSELFGIRIQAADGETEVWDPSVRFFKVYDENEKHIGSFYLDLYSRPKEKRGHVWMDPFFTRSRLLGTIPVAVQICNQSPPVGSTPSLMSFDEIKTLFHEFGHTLQHILTTVEYAGASGIINIEWDVVEVSSMAMENWIYDRDTIYSISRHYQTNDTFPKEMFDKYYLGRNFFGVNKLQQEVYRSALDMELHTSADSWKDVVKRMVEKYSASKPLPEDCYPATFTHIVDGAYAAGYYSYPLSEQLAQDEFAAFTEAGLENREAIKAVGKRFRDTFLSLGGGTHPLEVFRKFRGRDSTPDALFQRYGLKK